MVVSLVMVFRRKITSTDSFCPSVCLYVHILDIIGLNSKNTKNGILNCWHADLNFYYSYDHDYIYAHTYSVLKNLSWIYVKILMIQWRLFLFSNIKSSKDVLAHCSAIIFWRFITLINRILGLQQGSGLVGAGGAHVRDGRRVPTLLRRPANSDLWENCLREGKFTIFALDNSIFFQ